MRWSASLCWLICPSLSLSLVSPHSLSFSSSLVPPLSVSSFFLFLCLPLSPITHTQSSTQESVCTQNGLCVWVSVCVWVCKCERLCASVSQREWVCASLCARVGECVQGCASVSQCEWVGGCECVRVCVCFWKWERKSKKSFVANFRSKLLNDFHWK